MKPMAQQLTEIFDRLPEQEQQTLLDFAEFLKSRAPDVEASIEEPLGLPRPDEESVVSAIKRLKKNYPMIPQKDLLHETSDFMMQHMMQGKPADIIIDELEILFEAKYLKITGSEE